MSINRAPQCQAVIQVLRMCQFYCSAFFFSSLKFSKTFTSIVFSGLRKQWDMSHDKINIVDCKMLISKGHHHDSTWYHQDCPHAIVPSNSNRKHLCFPPVALLLVQLPWWRFHPKGCSPSPGRDASLAPGRPWTPLNGFQNGPDFWGGTAVQRNYEFGTHFKYRQSEVKQKKLWTTTGGSPQIFIKLCHLNGPKKATSRQIPKTFSFFFVLAQKLPKATTLFRHLLMHLLTPFR